MKKTFLATILFVLLVPALAFADGPYKVMESDGSYIVTMNDNKTNTGTVYPKKEDAQHAANKLNKDEKKRNPDGGDEK